MKAEIIKVAYEFEDSKTGEERKGNSYYARTEVPGLGQVDFKITTKTDLERATLDKHATEVVK